MSSGDGKMLETEVLLKGLMRHERTGQSVVTDAVAARARVRDIMWLVPVFGRYTNTGKSAKCIGQRADTLFAAIGAIFTVGRDREMQSGRATATTRSLFLCAQQHLSSCELEWNQLELENAVVRPVPAVNKCSVEIAVV